MQITVIGTGLMGQPMVERLLKTGYEVVVYNRSREKAEALQALGVTVARNAVDAIQASSLTILMVADAQAIREVLFPPTNRPNLQTRTILQMGTIAPSESRRLAQEVRISLGEYLEAPVLGSIAEAKNGKLLVMVGATEAQYHRWKEVLACFGEHLIHIGPIGQAACVKLALNQLIASHIAAFSLSLGLIQRTGVAVEHFMNILRHSALIAPMFEKKLPRLLERHYHNPNFPTAHLLKDVKLFLGEAQAAQLDTTGLEGIRQLLEKTLDMGLERVDYSSIFEIVTPKEP